MKMRHGMSKRQRFKGLEEGYRSGLEETTAKDLAKRGVKFTYEETKIKWVDLKHRTYTPDFLLLNNGIIIETKGRFVSTDRRKHREIKDQYPDLDIRFVFNNSKSRLYKGAKSCYGDWCDRYGFLYADKLIPQEWIEETK
tara:strand:- start:19 stop:438 length:420 start_codon:yes stop_codon:yes gene_type:complete